MNDLTSVLLVIVSIMLMGMSYKYHKTVNSLNYALRKVSNTKRNIDFRVVTKEEFLMERMKKGTRKEEASRQWDMVSKGYNFAIQKGDNYFYSVEYVNEYLS